MIDNALDFLTSKGKLFAFVAGGLAVGFVAFCLYVAVMSVFMAFGIDFTQILAGGIGCGIGCWLVNGCIIASYA